MGCKMNPIVEIDLIVICVKILIIVKIVRNN